MKIKNPRAGHFRFTKNEARFLAALGFFAKIAWSALWPIRFVFMLIKGGK